MFTLSANLSLVSLMGNRVLGPLFYVVPPNWPATIQITGLRYGETITNVSTGTISGTMIIITIATNTSVTVTTSTGRQLVVTASIGTQLVAPFAYTNSLFPFTFYRGTAGVSTNFDRTTWAPTPDNPGYAGSITAYYVNIARPDDSGDGLSLGAAKKSIVAAIQAGNAQANPYIVYVQAGTYPRLYGLGSGSSPTKPCALIATNGRVDVGLFDLLTWTLDTGTTYKATRADVRRVINMATTDQDGLRPDVTWAGDLATCRALRGTWWTDNVTVYVNRGDGAAVTDANTRALLITGGVAVLRASTGGNTYVSGFDVSGGFTPLLLTNSPTNRFVAEDCTFRYSSGDDGVVLSGTKNLAPGGAAIQNLLGAAFIRCDASSNQTDGFNSHILSGVQAFVFTMDCTGFNNGRQGSTSNNFITTHDGGKWIDLRGTARRNAGGQIAIVNDNTAMWCIETQASASRGDVIYGGGVQPSDFLVDQTEGGGTRVALYLDNCKASLSTYSLNAAYGTINVRGGLFLGLSTTAAGGSITSY